VGAPLRDIEMLSLFERDHRSATIGGFFFVVPAASHEKWIPALEMPIPPIQK
jgi:hypothetical protein